MIEREFARIRPYPRFTWRGLVLRLHRLDRQFRKGEARYYDF